VVVAVAVGLKTVDVDVTVLTWNTVGLKLVEVMVFTTVEVIVVGTMTVEVLVVVCSGASAGTCMGRRTATRCEDQAGRNQRSDGDRFPQECSIQTFGLM
jgi:hypothetical protein